MNIKELFFPSIKCKRVGHKIKKETRKIIMNSYEYREVAKKCLVEFKVCKRCGWRSKPKIKEKIEGYTSATFSSDLWDAIKEEGYFFDN